MNPNHIFIILSTLFLFLQVGANLEESSILCYCHNCLNKSCILKPGGLCFTYAIQDKNDNSMNPEDGIWEYGCLDGVKENNNSDKKQNISNAAFLHCNIRNAPFIIPQGTSCCKNYNFCNKDLTVNYSMKSTATPYDFRRNSIAIIIIIVVCLLVIFIGITIFIFINRKNSQLIKNKDDLLLENNSSIVNGNLHSMIDSSTGSGSGLPVLVQRTIAKELTLIEIVGKGRFGEVWKASWRGENIAVKIFFSTEEPSWRREADIYETVLIRHENILGFIASDIKGTGSWTQLMLITDYLPLGSLYDYLRSEVPDQKEAFQLLYSAANGLSHLHSEIIGTKGKPSMAHRDIKSRNILVKQAGICCLADLGLAVKYNSESKNLDIPVNKTRQGTRRYMAPEILEEKLEKNSIDAFKSGDIYAFGLVMWEVFHRISWNDEKEPTDANLPFYEYVRSDPSIEEMHKTVCLNKHRPDTKRFSLNLQRFIAECWSENPNSRLPILRVKKYLKKFL